MRQKLFSVSIKDFQVDTFRGSGNGGQNVNKVETCVRFTHKESGAITLGTEERTQWANKQIAFKKMVKHPKFNAWLRVKTARLLGTMKSPEQIEKEVDEMMKEDNLKVESKDEQGKKWLQMVKDEQEHTIEYNKTLGQQ